ncbi:MAG: response regulator [Acidimicrobiales bacterium]
MSVQHTPPAFSALTASTIADLWSRVQMRSESRLHQLELLISHLFDRALTPEEAGHGIAYANERASRLGLLGITSGASKLRRVAELLDLPEVTSLEPGRAARRPELAIQLASQTDEVRANLEDAAADLQLLSRGPHSVLVVGAQGELTDAILWSAASAGLAVRYLAVHEVHRSREVTADAIVQVLDDADSIGDVTAPLREFCPATPIVSLSPRLEPSQQVQLARSADLVLPRRSHPDVVSEEVLRLVRGSNIDLTVGLFGPGAAQLATALTDNEPSLLASVYPSGTALVDAVVQGEVRSVLCAPQPDGRPAINLVRLLRSERRGRTIVIGCLAGDPSGRSEALNTGADCFWLSNAERSDIAAEMKSRVRRNATLDASLSEVADNSSVPWAIGSVLLQRLINESGRSKTTVAVALLSLPSDPELDDEVARAFRRSDVISRRDDKSLVVALRGADRATLTRRLQSVLERMQPAVRVRSAIMEYPTDARSATQALERAESAIARSAKLGGPAVVGIDWCEDHEAPPDVLVVDPDPALASALVSSLDRFGLDCLALDPVAQSAANKPRYGQMLPPRVAVLDIDTDRGGHMDELRHFRRLYPAESTKLIVLASDVNLALIDHAFSAEAFDVVQKPFNLPLLVRRIQRELS